MAEISRVLRVAVSRCGYPVLKRIICVLPEDMMYSALMSSSSMVLERPRFRRMGLSHFSQFLEHLEILHVARPHLNDIDIGKQVIHGPGS